jgi:hypothetical protein
MEAAATGKSTAAAKAAVPGNRRMGEAAQAGARLSRCGHQQRRAAGAQQGRQHRGTQYRGRGHLSGLR